MYNPNMAPHVIVESNSEALGSAYNQFQDAFANNNKRLSGDSDKKKEADKVAIKALVTKTAKAFGWSKDGTGPRSTELLWETAQALNHGVLKFQVFARFVRSVDVKGFIPRTLRPKPY
jgi:hypothetical protein